LWLAALYVGTWARVGSYATGSIGSCIRCGRAISHILLPTPHSNRFLLCPSGRCNLCENGTDHHGNNTCTNGVYWCMCGDFAHGSQCNASVGWQNLSDWMGGRSCDSREYASSCTFIYHVSYPDLLTLATVFSCSTQATCCPHPHVPQTTAWVRGQGVMGDNKMSNSAYSRIYLPIEANFVATLFLADAPSQSPVRSYGTVGRTPWRRRRSCTKMAATGTPQPATGTPAMASAPRWPWS